MKKGNTVTQWGHVVYTVGNVWVCEYVWVRNNALKGKGRM